MSDDQREKVARWLRDIVKLSKMAGVKMSYDVHADELLSLIEDGGERQAGERFGWTVWKGQTCVECPDCAFTMGAGHTDEPNGESYSCPACSQPTEGAEPVAGVTADGIVEWYDMDLPPGGKLFLHPPQEREARLDALKVIAGPMFKSGETSKAIRNMKKMRAIAKAAILADGGDDE